MADIPTTPTPSPKPVAQAAAPDASKAMTLFVMIVATLYFGREVLVPITLALLLAFVLAPLVDLLRRTHLGKVPSVLLGVILALAVVVSIGGVIGTQIAELSTHLPDYVSTVETKVASVRSYALGQVTHVADFIGSKRTTPSAGPAGHPAETAPPVAAPLTASAAPQQSGSSAWGLVERYLSPVLSPIATIGIIFVVAVFALLQREDLRDRLIRLIGSDDLHRTTLAIDEAGRRLSRYFLTQVSINTLFGIVVGIGLVVVGVPNPILWGILSALLRFVPYIGSFISAALPMALAAAVEPGWSMVLWTAGLYLGVEGVTGQVIEPMVYGHSTGLSPFAVIVAAIFWSWLWGPIGLILSTPLTLCVVVIGRHVARLEFLDVMLGDSPALTPVESFYQRILAGDADEAQDHAETLLKQRSLSTYYDEIVLKGLQLAANDAQGGSLNHEQLDRVRATIKQLIRGLETHEDRQPPLPKPDKGAIEPDDDQEVASNPDPQRLSLAKGSELSERWANPSTVLCVAGRGPLDDAASAILMQLLAKHGMGGHVVNHDDVSRDKIEALDVTGVAIACISYLDISGNPAHLRYLMQRLRRRLPSGTPIAVGLWPPGDVTLRDETMRKAIGADFYVTSVEQAVTSCTQVAERADRGRGATAGTPSERTIAVSADAPPR